MTEGGFVETAPLLPWTELSGLEQALVRCGLRQRRTSGVIEAYGSALRWEGAPDAPLVGGYSSAEERALIPGFADAAAGLISQGILRVRRIAGDYLDEEVDPVVDFGDLDGVLRDPGTWIRETQKPEPYWLDASPAAHELWYHPAYLAMARTDYPAWRDLGEPERRILVSAMEFSGSLTGYFGIWCQPDPELTPTQRLAAVDELLAPLLPFVRDGLLEVQYRADVASGSYTVIPLEELRSAFNGVEIWHDGDDAEFFEGAHAVFTLAGYATWHTKRPS